MQASVLVSLFVAVFVVKSLAIDEKTHFYDEEKAKDGRVYVPWAIDNSSDTSIEDDINLKQFRGKSRTTRELVVGTVFSIGAGLANAMYRIRTMVLDEAGDRHRKILQLFQNISQKLDQIDTGLIDENRMDYMNTLNEYAEPINFRHNKFIQYQLNKDGVEHHSLEKFANKLIFDGDDSIIERMYHVYKLVDPDGPALTSLTQKSMLKELLLKSANDHPFKRKSVFEVLEETQKESDVCGSSQTSQQQVMELYLRLVVLFGKGYAMMNFAFMILKEQGKGEFTVERQMYTKFYEHFCDVTLQKAVEYMEKTSNSFWRCDPDNHVQGETYEMFTELLQAHIENEVDLNKDGSCRKTCLDYRRTRVYGCRYPDDELCGSSFNKKCRGTLHECRDISTPINVCFSDLPHRRYNGVFITEASRSSPYIAHVFRLGPNNLQESCQNRRKIFSWSRWFVMCKYCRCLCDDKTSGTSDRYVSLLPSTTNLDDNMVLTGIKFSKHKRVITMEIQQGRAMPHGQVDPSSLNWVSPPEVDVKNERLAGLDYRVLDYDVRRLNLDNLQAPSSHVITGVRFRLQENKLTLEIRITPIDIASGTLNGELSYWFNEISNPRIYESPRPELTLDHYGDPAKNTAPNVIDNLVDSFVTFSPTSYSDDFSQLTVPYFDSLPVTLSPPMMITGLNLHHKGNPSNAGFISFRAKHVDFLRYLKTMQ